MRIPMVVAAAPEQTIYTTACVLSADKTSRTCDFSKLESIALPGTYCLGTECTADINLAPNQWGHSLFITYPGTC